MNGPKCNPSDRLFFLYCPDSSYYSHDSCCIFHESQLSAVFCESCLDSAQYEAYSATSRNFMPKVKTRRKRNPYQSFFLLTVATNSLR